MAPATSNPILASLENLILVYRGYTDKNRKNGYTYGLSNNIHSQLNNRACHIY